MPGMDNPKNVRQYYFWNAFAIFKSEKGHVLTMRSLENLGDTYLEMASNQIPHYCISNQSWVQYSKNYRETSFGL